MKLNLDQLRKLIKLLDESNLTEIEIEQDDDRIRIRREPAGIANIPPAKTVAPVPAQSMPDAVEEEAAYVTCPFVGTFYRSPAPDADAFVELGDTIAPGQVLCIVEAMKLMNEIEAESEGKIVEILVEDGKPVEYGDRLFRIEIA